MSKEENKKNGNILTFESLFDLYHKEKTTSQLNSIDPGFLDDIFTYLKQKRSFIESIKKKSDMLSQSQLLNMEKQFSNAVRLLKDLLERRQRKIIDIALNKVRIHNPILDDSFMHPYEIQFYHSVFGLFNSFKKNMIDKLMVSIYQGKTDFNTKLVLEDGDSILKLLADNDLAEYAKINLEDYFTAPSSEIPDSPKDAVDGDDLAEKLEIPIEDGSLKDKEDNGEDQDITKDSKNADDHKDNKDNSGNNDSNDSKDTVNSKDETTSDGYAFSEDKSSDSKDSSDAEEKPVNVKFVKDVDKFIGTDLEVYGPYKSDATVEVPQNIASLLIKKELVIKID